MTVSIERPVVVMIGGVACDESLWEDEIFALSDVADCFPVLPQGDSIEAMAGDVLARVGQKRMSLVGHSMGGYVALAIQRAEPDRVERLALIGTGANLEGDSQGAARLALIDLVRERGFEALISKLVPAMVSPETLRAKAKMSRLEAMVRRAGAERFLRQQTAVMHRPDAMAGLAGIHVPTVVIAGQDDRIIAPCHGREMAGLIERAEFHLLEKCGHIAPVERFEAVSMHLRNWVTQI